MEQVPSPIHWSPGGRGHMADSQAFTVGAVAAGWTIARPAMTSPHSMRRPGRWLVATVLAVALLWLAVIPFGMRPALVTGTSMQPNLWMGDVIVTRQVPPGDLRPGDVVRYRADRISILHRVTEVRHRAGRYILITQGDNNDMPDHPVDQDQLEGKLILLVPRVGWIPLSARHLFRPPLH